MKKAILFALVTLLPACAGNDSRDIRTVIEMKRDSELAIRSCSVVIGRENTGDGSDTPWRTYTEKANVVVSNRSTTDAAVHAGLLAIDKNGSILSGTLIDGIAKAGTTTSLESAKSVPVPSNFIEDHDFTATDSYRCSLAAPPSAAFFRLPGFPV